MTIEVIGYSFSGGELHIYATNVDERHLQLVERNRYDDGADEELEFVFSKENIKYLYNWLKRQKSVKEAKPRNLGEAVNATLGTVTTISGKYLELA